MLSRRLSARWRLAHAITSVEEASATTKIEASIRFSMPLVSYRDSQTTFASSLINSLLGFAPHKRAYNSTSPLRHGFVLPIRRVAPLPFGFVLLQFDVAPPVWLRSANSMSPLRLALFTAKFNVAPPPWLRSAKFPGRPRSALIIGNFIPIELVRDNLDGAHERASGNAPLHGQGGRWMSPVRRLNPDKFTDCPLLS